MLSPVVFVIFVVGVVYGDVIDIESDDVHSYNNSNGHFFVNPDASIPPNENWTAVIEPINATRIFVVIEKIILSKSDTIHIISKDETLKVVNGSSDPFSLLVDNENLTIKVTTSSDQSTTREFKGYYTDSGCIYQVNSTFVLSTPLIFTHTEFNNCSFSFVPQQKLSKLGVTFQQFNLSKGTLQVVINGSHSFNYSGNSIPPEIIADNKLEFNFSLSENDSAQFEYENVFKESEYVKLNKRKQSHNFTFAPSSAVGYYRSGEECHWVIKSEENTTISFKFFNISLPSGTTRITINDGKNKFSNLLLYASSHSEDLKKRYISSSGNFLWISIMQPDKNTLVLGEVKMNRNGGYRKGSGKLSVPINSTEVIYLLEEEAGEIVVLHEHKGILTVNSTIYVYNDFYADSLPVMIYNTSLPHYPIVSSTSRMMVIGRNFIKNANYEANFMGVKQGCYKMSHAESGEYLLSGNCNATCKWIVSPVEDMDSVISLHIHQIKFEEKDNVTLSLLDATQTVIVNITSLTNMLPEFYLPTSLGFLLNSERGNCSAATNMLYATFEKIKGCSGTQKLEYGSHLSISSPNFPDRYPLWAHCWTNITTANNTKNGYFLLTFNKIDLAATHCLTVRGIIGHSNMTSHKYEGELAILPKDLILNNNASVEFSAQPCNSTKKQPLNLSTASGFSLDILAADCGESIAKSEGNFSTPGYPKNTNASICIWILEVPEKDNMANLPNIVNFTLIKNSSADFELTIYDGPSVRNETIKNQSASTLLSRTNSLIFVYRHHNSSKTSPGICIQFHSQACTATCNNGLCMHDDWKCNKHNDCGDNSDEIDCEAAPFVTTTPSPPSENKSYGVSPVALGLGLPIAFILGIAATIYLPPLIRRFRSGQYHQFRDVSADA